MMKTFVKKKFFIVKMFKSAHMFISFKLNWTNNHKINRVYSMKMKNQKFINEIFDRFHEQKIMKWFSRFIFFEYLVFVIWKTMMKDDKSEKTTRDNKYSWIKSDNANRRIFHVVSNRHNNNRDWVQSHFNCRCSEVFLSVNRQKKNVINKRSLFIEIKSNLT